MGDIGYQDGIEAFEQWFRKLSAFVTAYNKWIEEVKTWNALPDDVRENVDIPVPPVMPKIPLEGPNYVEGDKNTWPWPKKFFDNTIRTLKDDHDAAVEPLPPPPPPPPPPPDPDKMMAPMTHYAAPGADARFCTRGLPRNENGEPYEPSRPGIRYTENGLCHGGRSGKFVAVLKPANSMDGMEPCDGYTKDGRTFPPWPPESYEV